MVGGYQWLGEFVYGSGGLMDATTRSRISALFDKAQKAHPIKPLRVSIKMDQHLAPVESYASFVGVTGAPDDLKFKLKVDSHYGVEMNSLYLVFNQNGTYAFESI